jgi:uncharacterized protein
MSSHPNPQSANPLDSILSAAGQPLAPTFCVFTHEQLIASGELPIILPLTKAYLETDPTHSVLIFDNQTGQQVDFDFSGTVDQLLARAQPQPTPERAGPGRPRLGVVCREVSLLPRHWEWLERQNGGCSGALRRLVDEARKRDPEGEARAQARDGANRFLWAMAGNLPDFEEATRALFAGDYPRMLGLMKDWPSDIRGQVCRMLSIEGS